MRRTAKDTGKYQHSLRKLFANGALEHVAVFTINTAMFYTLLHCKGFLVLSSEPWDGEVCVFGNDIEPLFLLNQKSSRIIFYLFMLQSKMPFAKLITAKNILKPLKWMI